MNQRIVSLLMAGVTVGYLTVLTPAWSKKAPPPPLPPLPKGTSAPRTAGGGGMRGAYCPKVDDYVTTMVPLVYELGGLTVKGYPTLWVYIPFPISSDMLIEVEVEKSLPEAEIDLSHDVKQFRFVPQAGSAGLYGLQLSKDSGLEPLQVGQPYVWSFKLYCGGEKQISIRPPELDRAWITRVEPSPQLNEQVRSGATAVEKSSIYRDESLWYDALHQLAITQLDNDSLGETDTAALQQAWQSLLEAAELEFVQNAPIVRLIPLISE